MVESFKIDHFVRCNDGTSFPDYESLTSRECKEIRSALEAKLGLPPDSAGVVLVSRLADAEESCPGVNAEDDLFDLHEFVTSIDINPVGDVLINWYRFDKIDRMMFADLAEFFDDIWYPSSDDIDIFDSTLQWVLSVSHSGHVRYVKL